MAVLAAALAPAGLGCGGNDAALSAAQLRDPVACQTCHPSQFAEWSGSMHAYAADDPVFVAMNQRGQRETSGALGDFCVKCHAPMALRDGRTADGTNLAALPAAEKGVTCFFCHSTQSIDGTHNNPISLVTDGRLFGPITDPDPSAPHGSAYAALLDDRRTESASACGACHDIVNGHDVALERTFEEWQETLFAIPPHGLTCAACHMSGRDGPAASTSTKTRRLHDHGFPAVDVGLTPFPNADPVAQARDVQTTLDGTLQGTICLDDVARRIVVALDNVGAGHAWPSGAAQDRRAWVEVTAAVGDRVLYRSGLAPGETTATTADPDLWLLRDCIYDDSGAEVQMFWAAASHDDNALPGAVTPDLQKPATLVRTHRKRVYPVAQALSETPDRITVDVFLKPIGDDVLASLIDSGDLAAADAAAVPTFRLGGGAQLTWTRAASTSYVDGATGNRLACVSAGGAYTPVGNIDAAVSHARCAP
jgi:hypothetical protein